VQQYFPRDVPQVELELDHLSIVCELEPSFWEGRPEICDFRLSSWLVAKRNSGKLAAEPAPVAMIPSGEHSFRIQMISVEELDQAQTTTTSVVAAAPKSLAAVVPSMNRRRFDVGNTPERRRVARLKSDERPSSSANH